MRRIKQSWIIKISQKLSKHVVTIIRFSCCIFIGLVLSSKVTSEKASELSNGIVASNDILLDKGIRGVFPPLGGTTDQLLGKWNQTIVTSHLNTTRVFNNYTINFKANGDIQVTNLNCKGDVKFLWHIFYFNICFIEKEKPINGNNEMEIPNEKEDEECIYKDGEFINMLTNGSIWSIHSKNLYIISEIKKADKIESSMLIFEKAGI